MSDSTCKHYVYWSGDTVIGTGHLKVSVTYGKSKSGLALLGGSPSGLLAQVACRQLMPLERVSKTLTVNFDKEFRIAN